MNNSVSRFWDKYTNKTVSYGVPERARRSMFGISTGLLKLILRYAFQLCPGILLDNILK